jgi:hypothetical protein
MNRSWHEKHPMPSRATMAQRIKWHRAHAKHCACRPIPRSVREAMRESMGTEDDSHAKGR